jgi:hypothetical protein
VISKYAHWFDHLSAHWLFIYSGLIVAAIWYGTEVFYQREYAQGLVSENHLRDLKVIAQRILDGINKKEATLKTNLGKDCEALFSHDHMIRKECKWWDSKVLSWSQSAWRYQTGLAASFDENGLNHWPFNRNDMIALIMGLCRLREENFQYHGAIRQDMQWTWSDGQITTPTGRKNTLIAGDEGGTIFIYDVDDPGLDIDIEESKQRLISIFENADGSPELREWVEREIALSHDERVGRLKDRLHDFTLLDRLRVGHGCKRCNT